MRLAQIFNVVSLFSGYPVEPIDLPAHTRHLDAYRAFITLTEKPWHAYSLGNGRVEDALEMICMARGIDTRIGGGGSQARGAQRQRKHHGQAVLRVAGLYPDRRAAGADGFEYSSVLRHSEIV